MGLAAAFGMVKTPDWFKQLVGMTAVGTMMTVGLLGGLYVMVVKPLMEKDHTLEVHDSEQDTRLALLEQHAEAQVKHNEQQVDTDKQMLDRLGTIAETLAEVRGELRARE